MAVDLSDLCPISFLVVSMLPVTACTKIPNVCRAQWKEIFFSMPTFLAILLRAASTLALAGRWNTKSSLPLGGIHDKAVLPIGTALRALVFFWTITSVFVSLFLLMSLHRRALMSLIRSPVRQAKPKALCASATPGLLSSEAMNLFSSSGVRYCLCDDFGLGKMSDFSNW